MTLSYAKIFGISQVVPVIGQWVAYTPTFVGFGTVTDVGSFSWRQVGESIEVEGRYTAGTSTAVTASITLPNSFTAAPQGTFAGVRGRWTRFANATATTRKFGPMLFTNASNVVQFSSDDYTAALAPSSALTATNVGTGEIIEINFSVPITGWVANVVQGAGLATTLKPGIVYRSPQTTIVVTGTGWTTTRAIAIAYMDNNGIWRMTFNIAGTVTSASRTSYTAAVTGTVFKSGQAQAIGGALDISGVVAQNAYVGGGTGNVISGHAVGTTTGYQFSGDVELDAKPSWA